jgi:F-type H+-transporting ATPase subunit a
MADPAELMAHVQDAEAFHFPGGLEWHIPQPFLAFGFHITKFMVLEVVAAVLMIAIFVPLGRRIASGRPPRGRLWNLFEMLLMFVRDEIARPAIGRHDSDRFLPFLWTMFFFILFLNLLGLVPWAGSPTAALGVTGAVALMTFFVVVGAGIAKFGPIGFWLGQVPHMDVPWFMAIFIKPMIFFIEAMGLCVKHFILAMRLFANIFAGHLVLVVIIGFIAETVHSWLFYGVMPASVFGAVAISLLELLVALLQAYVFAFLSAIFIGMAVHQH